jgi:hypothetical protein
MLAVNATPEPSGYVQPSTSPPGHWIAFEYDEGQYRYAGTYDTQEAAQMAAGLQS